MPRHRSCLKSTMPQPESTAIIRAWPSRGYSDLQHTRQSSASAMLASSGACASFQADLEAELKLNGFLVDYVIHLQEQVPGPHAIEVKLSNVRLFWPFLANLQLVMDIVEVYSHFAKQSFVHLQPPNTAARKWMFVNVLLEHGQLLAAGREQVPVQQSSGGYTSWLPAALLQWDVLRVGYDWGADSEFVLLVTMQKLAASLVKSIKLDLIKRTWDHQSGLAVASPDVLSPMSGRLCWHASKPPGGPARAAAHASSGKPSADGSCVSSQESFASCKTYPVEARRFASTWNTEHQHTVSADFDSVKLQLVIANRWHIQALLHALATAQSQSPEPQQQSEPANGGSTSAKDGEIQRFPDAASALLYDSQAETACEQTGLSLPAVYNLKRSLTSRDLEAPAHAARKLKIQTHARPDRKANDRRLWHEPHPVASLSAMAAADAEPMRVPPMLLRSAERGTLSIWHLNSSSCQQVCNCLIMFMHQSMIITL